MKIRTVSLTIAMALCAPLAMAQDRPAISLAVPDPARWDVALYAGWTAVNKSDTAAEWDEWSDAATFGGSAGYYWTPHAKLELDVASTTWGEVFVQQQLGVSPSFRFGEIRSRSDRVAGGLQYQFLENAWFHPFAGAGVEAARESDRLELSEQRSCPPSPCTPLPLPQETSVSYHVRPFVQTGFKWYVAERAFIRSDIRFVVDTVGLDTVRWHTGVGVDF